jgi:hypothetical protein
MLLWPWGGLIARLVEGGERCFVPVDEAQALHWTVCYPTRALLPMMALVGEVRSLDPAAVRVPTLVFYSRRDQIVDPAAIERLADQGMRATMIQVDDSGDPAHHILAGDIMSPATTERVRARINDFLRDVPR